VADECLNVNWFLSLEDARGKIEAWRRHYNERRSHCALEDVPPREFASNGGAIAALAGFARTGIFAP
jgi:putative transposase